MIRVFLIDALGNLILFGLAYYWLGLPASSTGSLALSAGLLVVMLLLLAYLIALAFNRQPRAAIARIPAMLAWLALAALPAGVLLLLMQWTPAIDNWISSALTFATRTPIQLPYSRLVLLATLLFLAIRLLLPVAARTAALGFDGLRDWRPAPSSLLRAALYFFAGLWLPWQLFWWIPTIASFEGQMASFLLRVGTAFALYVGSWLLFAWHIRAKALPPER